jgi:lipoate-protein ligase A
MTYPIAIWRIIYHNASNGAWNMAVDEAILEAVGGEEAPPTLRLYAWEPPCLSLGHAQPVSDVSLDALKERECGLVRRPTGGRAILHTDELTYSVCGLANDPRLAGGVLRSYRVLAQALMKALELLGIDAEVKEKHKLDTTGGNRSSSMNPNPVCFEEPSDYEITFRGKKLIGSAQARRKEVVLQHGSLPLGGDITRIVQVLSFPDPLAREEASRRLLARATSVGQILGKTITWETAAQAFATSFAGTLELEFRKSDLTSSEIKRAEELIEDKYANWKWMGRV